MKSSKSRLRCDNNRLKNKLRPRSTEQIRIQIENSTSILPEMGNIFQVE